MRNQGLAGVGRLAVDATIGLTSVVEAMHGTIASVPFPIGTAPRDRTRGLTRFVYQTIRSVTRIAGGGLELVLPHLSKPTPPSESVLSVLNGIVGDHLAATNNPLAVSMELRSRGAQPAKRVAVFVHGLCGSDAQWLREGHDHGQALSRSLGYTPLYVRYNTGRHVSTNGRELAEKLEALVAGWPVPVEHLVLAGHSMGGLVARSACHYGRLAGHSWPERLRSLVFLGTPHHGAPLERAGSVADLLLAVSPYSAPLSWIGGNRSAGICDLRFGSVVDEDWTRRSRRRDDPRTAVPLPAGVPCFAVAATLGARRGDAKDRLLGDGLVPVASALGEHSRFALRFADSRILTATGHMDLLSAPAVAEQLSSWLA